MIEAGPDDKVTKEIASATFLAVAYLGRIVVPPNLMLTEGHAFIARCQTSLTTLGLILVPHTAKGAQRPIPVTERARPVGWRFVFQMLGDQIGFLDRLRL